MFSAERNFIIQKTIKHCDFELSDDQWNVQNMSWQKKKK